ncbi:MAG: hypothetical protein RL173_2881 [Fibrobacterota bacterium]
MQQQSCARIGPLREPLRVRVVQMKKSAIPMSARGRGISIASFMIAVIGFITLGMLSGLGAVGYGIFNTQGRALLLGTGSAMSEQAAIGLSLPLWNYDSVQVRKTAESVLRVDAVRGVVVRQGRNGSLAIAVYRDESGRILDWDRPMPRVDDQVHRRPVLFADESIGEVEVVMTTRPLEERLSVIRTWIIGLVLVVALLLSGTLYFLLWKIALRPIKILEQFSKHIDGETFDRSIVENTSFHGELDSLRASIIRMVGLLEDRFASLRQETRRYSESEKRFRTLVDTIPDLIWLKDYDGVYLSCNSMFERFFGATESEIVGKTDYDFVARELADFFREHDRAAMIADRPSHNEEWVVFADDGHKALLETTKTPMYDSDGKLVGVLGIGRDITARRQAEDERRALDERMNNTQKLEALGVLVAGVSHNINNVLAAILGSASLRENLATDPDDRETYAMISTATRRGRDVVKSLLQFSRPTLSERAPVEVNGLLAEVVKLYRSTSLDRVKIVEDLVSEPLWIQGDAGSITNSFMNLCINAFDAMPDGGTITVGSRPDGEDWVETWVRDSGTGMPPEVLARAMEPFFTTKEVGKGTGLGLSMTHGVVKVHGGRMEISNDPSGGCLVKIRLPRIPVPIDPASSFPVSSGVPDTLQILLVDDDPDIRFLVTRMLKANGHTVVSVAGGQDAIDRVASGPLPDLVIMDQNMPGLDGIRTMERLRETHPDLPILISSGQPDIQEWDCFKKPRVGVISKPFDMAELMGKLDEFAKVWPR